MSMDVTLRLSNYQERKKGKIKRKLMVDKDKKSAWINESLNILIYVFKMGMPI